MKKIVITTAILLLAGCGEKPAPDASVPPAPTSVDQSNAQAPAPSAAPAQNAYPAPAQNTYPAPSATQQANRQEQQYQPSSQDYAPDEPQPVVSVYVDAPEEQPAPVLVEWAPPPMLVDTPPPRPADDDEWTGGYWVWEGNWVWAHGRWAPPPHHGYHWNNPYYEHRGESVVFVNGFWAAPGVSFVAPSPSMNITLAILAAGVRPGRRPEGPNGVFVPPPPGSHYGLIVPAPLGTSPAVVVGAPPIIRGGMHIVANNNRVTTTNVTNVTNITNVTVVAPANATANGQAVSVSVPGQAHLAAAQHPVVNAAAPEPTAAKPIQAYVAGRPPVALPPPQTVHTVMPPSMSNSRAATAAAPAAAAGNPAPPHAEHAAPESRAVAAAPPPAHQPPESAARPQHNESNQNHPPLNAVQPAQMERRNPPPAEARPGQTEMRNSAAQAEKHAPPPAAEARPAPVSRPEPMPQRQVASPPRAQVPISEPKPHAPAPGKPEEKDAKAHDKEKQ